MGAGTLLGCMRIAKGKRDRRERDRASRQASHGEQRERTDVKCGTKKKIRRKKSTQKSGGQNKKQESWEYGQITSSPNSWGNFQKTEKERRKYNDSWPRRMMRAGALIWHGP